MKFSEQLFHRNLDLNEGGDSLDVNLLGFIIKRKYWRTFTAQISVDMISK